MAKGVSWIGMLAGIGLIGICQSSSHEDRYAGTTHYTRTKGSSASFSFTGASRVYFIGFGLRNKSIDTTMDLTLDGVTTTVDQHVTGDRAQATLWSSGDLDVHLTHTIHVQKTSDNNGGRDLNVDAFILTIPDETSSLVSSPSTSRASSSSTFRSSPDGTIAESTSTRHLDTSTSSRALIWSPTELSVSFYGPASQAVSSVSTGTLTGPVQSLESTMSTATVVGAVLGSLAAVCMLGVGCFLMGRHHRRRSEEFLVPDLRASRGLEKTTSDLDDKPRLPANLPTQQKVFPKRAANITPVETAGSLDSPWRESEPPEEDIRTSRFFIVNSKVLMFEVMDLPEIPPVDSGRSGTVNTGSQSPTYPTDLESSMIGEPWLQGPPAYSPRRHRLSGNGWETGKVPRESTNQ
ncbi:hypothetical protein PIIN_09466 [Serendipita indica DSM 11827]|uniref:Transmembrane protein n=1 Tax=Serendipita indica (strain DSM 11827) TaxID=1109443 RepID=G4TVZ0_SERID|nr:hypothetical protein PIIN_09466 [Serendipita indica DSM 11827]